MWCCWIFQDDNPATTHSPKRTTTQSPARSARGWPRFLSPGPEQTEGFGRQQRIDRGVEEVLQGYSPSLSFPD